jgi:hypothetical protein
MRFSKYIRYTNKYTATEISFVSANSSFVVAKLLETGEEGGLQIYCIYS